MNNVTVTAFTGQYDVQDAHIWLSVQHGPFVPG